MEIIKKRDIFLEKTSQIILDSIFEENFNKFKEKKIAIFNILFENEFIKNLFQENDILDEININTYNKNDWLLKLSFYDLIIFYFFSNSDLFLFQNEDFSNKFYTLISYSLKKNGFFIGFYFNNNNLIELKEILKIFFIKYKKTEINFFNINNISILEFFNKNLFQNTLMINENFTIKEDLNIEFYLKNFILRSITNESDQNFLIENFDLFHEFYKLSNLKKITFDFDIIFSRAI